jgi:DNA-binding HxlR family transcriptional regulator
MCEHRAEPGPIEPAAQWVPDDLATLGFRDDRWCGVRWNSLSREDCSLARSLAVIGDRWTLLVLREAFLRVRRFEDFEKNLKIARRVLSERLALLVDEAILEKRRYQDNPPRHEYRLTEKGLALYPVVLSLVHWGDRYYAGKKGPPIIHTHKACGHDFRSVLTCSECGDTLAARDVTIRPGVGRRHAQA